ncbi:hypothetical protein INT48_001677 [Thamnidium elegans]|uniref:Endonuclease/exonuclease/phosphatase domain-containing protein n=1 Tax=Thamnidium elegans TaxID=101142 RepID=A0A8H7SLR9_9FUNG|nr:hypothetical protein INT48_001677 [Thamnidium elegans]
MNNSKQETLSVLSLNCWGLNIVSKERKFRLHAIADRISLEDYDIVALQEIWMRDDFEYMKAKVATKLPFTKYFSSGTLGSGLAILSRFPILSSTYLKFTLAGRPLKILQGDFYVGKGCGSVCVDHPEIGLLHACYDGKDEYEAQRITECWQIANSVRVSAAQGRHVILAGDFNSIPSSNCYQIIKNHAFVTDSWLEIHQDSMTDSLSRLERNQLSATDCIQLFGITCDSPLDSWTQHMLKQEAHSKNIGDRLDYIFYRRTPEITCQQSTVVLEEYIPGTQWNYSDHFGVHSLFTMNGHSNRAIGNFAPVPSQLARPDFTKLLPSTLDTAIEILALDQALAKTTANKNLVKSSLSLIVMFGLYVTQIVLSVKYKDDTNTILLSTIICGFLIIVFSISAVVYLIVGFVSGGNEERSLNQYTLDLRVCLETLQSQIRRESLGSTETSIPAGHCLTQDESSFSSSYSTNSTSEGL